MNVENKHKVTLGSDPESFINDGNEVVSAEGLTGGSKHDPKPIDDKGHMIQEDGIMFEYNIPPCSTVEEWIYSHEFVQDYLSVLASASGFKLDNSVSVEVNPKYLQTIQATTFGCEPDFNVYERNINEAPDSNTNLRCAGGHVAIGYPNPDEDTTEKIVKMFDLFVTLPALFKDNDTRRRELYGKPGSFRFKEFGCECRALSNFWIHTKEDMAWVFNQTMKAVNVVLDGEADELIEKYSIRTRKAINENDKEEAEKIISLLEVENNILITI